MLLNSSKSYGVRPRCRPRLKAGCVRVTSRGSGEPQHVIAVKDDMPVALWGQGDSSVEPLKTPLTGTPRGSSRILSLTAMGAGSWVNWELSPQMVVHTLVLSGALLWQR